MMHLPLSVTPQTSPEISITTPSWAININLAALPIFKDKSQDNIINLSIIYLIIMIYGTQNMLYNDDLNILRKMISVLILL